MSLMMTLMLLTSLGIGHNVGYAAGVGHPTYASCAFAPRHFVAKPGTNYGSVTSACEIPKKAAVDYTNRVAITHAVDARLKVKLHSL